MNPENSSFEHPAYKKSTAPENKKDLKISKSDKKVSGLSSRLEARKRAVLFAQESDDKKLLENSTTLLKDELLAQAKIAEEKGEEGLARSIKNTIQKINQGDLSFLAEANWMEPIEEENSQKEEWQNIPMSQEEIKMWESYFGKKYFDARIVGQKRIMVEDKDSYGYETEDVYAAYATPEMKKVIVKYKELTNQGWKNMPWWDVEKDLIDINPSEVYKPHGYEDDQPLLISKDLYKKLAHLHATRDKLEQKSLFRNYKEKGWDEIQMEGGDEELKEILDYLKFNEGYEKMKFKLGGQEVILFSPDFVEKVKKIINDYRSKKAEGWVSSIGFRDKLKKQGFHFDIPKIKGMMEGSNPWKSFPIIMISAETADEIISDLKDRSRKNELRRRGQI